MFGVEESSIFVFRSRFPHFRRWHFRLFFALKWMADNLCRGLRRKAAPGCSW